MGASTLTEMRYQSHSRALRYRNTDMLVASSGFENVFKHCDRLYLNRVVNTGQALEVKRLITKYSKFDKTVNDLRKEAAQKGIKNYSRMSREELEKELDYV